ncbi:unnamed protein product [Ambrosiozyma monospora]|uniref:Unnamed protein product n=1 Tax=Ambrosiozyma monospora TaxID=43982 RepID=A0A9W6T6F8_AMBMO|nr:unnamed protein product [Ambrosiozyma monospora]
MNLKMLVKDVDFIMGCSLGKFEIGLLLFYYLLKFVNYNVSLTSGSGSGSGSGCGAGSGCGGSGIEDGDVGGFIDGSIARPEEKFEFLRDVLQLNLFMSSALNLDKDSGVLEFTCCNGCSGAGCGSGGCGGCGGARFGDIFDL